MSAPSYNVRVTVTRMEEYGDSILYSVDEANTSLESATENAILELNMFAYTYREPTE